MTRVIAGRWGGRRLRTPPGDGTRPGAVVTFADVEEEVLRRLQPRIDGVFVRNKTIRAQVAPPPRPEPR